MKRWLSGIAVLSMVVPIGAPATTRDAIQASERTASASWILLERVRYVVEVTERSATDASVGSGLQAQRTVSGEVAAAVELCDEDLVTCERGQTWMATLGSSRTNGVAFDADPAMRTATLSGWLRDADGDNPCLFTVRWAGDGAPSPVLSDPTLTPDGAHAGLAIASTGTASVTASCWRTDLSPEFSSGPGRLGANHSLMILAS